MQDTNFIIKVTDFLAEKIYEDTIHFSDKFSTSLPHLTKGISCDISIQGGGDKTILLTISSVAFALDHSCDICSEIFTTEYILENLYIKCYADYDEGLLAEDEISFESKHGQIDLEQVFVQEIVLQEEIQKMCIKCQKKPLSKTNKTVNTTNISRVIDKK